MITESQTEEQKEMLNDKLGKKDIKKERNITISDSKIALIGFDKGYSQEIIQSLLEQNEELRQHGIGRNELKFISKRQCSNQDKENLRR